MRARMRTRFRIAMTLGLALASAAVAGCVGGIDVLGPDPNCKDVDIQAVLHVDAGDPRRVWALDVVTKRDLKVTPRPSLGWSVDPDQPGMLVDRTGTEVAHDGVLVRQACFDAWSNTYFIGPEGFGEPAPAPS